MPTVIVSIELSLDALMVHAWHMAWLNQTITPIFRVFTTVFTFLVHTYLETLIYVARLLTTIVLL